VRENWIVLPTFNCRKLTEECLQSLLSQDIGKVNIFTVDGGSTDGTLELIRASQRPCDRLISLPKTAGVSKAWNIALSYLFDVLNAPHVLVVNNDTRLRKDAYRLLVSDSGGFVTCVGTSTAGAQFPGGEPTLTRRPHPDFSCFLILKETWRKVGFFDETMRIYCSDGDYHLRMARADIDAYCLDIPFFHYASGTLKSVEVEDKERILEQASHDREAFEIKWGCAMGTPGYYKLFETKDVQL
jgi:GT2 family glycosyltransferase